MKKRLLAAAFLTICSYHSVLAADMLVNSMGESAIEENAVLHEEGENNNYGAIIPNVGVGLENSHEGKLFYFEENFHQMVTLPSYTITSPSGMVASYGVIFAGFSGQTNHTGTDAALGVGTGFGNADKSLGGAVSLGFGSVDPRDGGAGNRGSLSIDVGHNFTDLGLGIAVGASAIDLWHSNNDYLRNPSFYGAVTKFFPNDIAPIVVTGGLGNNGYAGVSEKTNLTHKVQGFGAIAAYVLPQLSLIADYTSEVLSAGVGIIPFPKYPISIILGVNDITNKASDTPYFTGALSGAYIF